MFLAVGRELVPDDKSRKAPQSTQSDSAINFKPIKKHKPSKRVSKMKGMHVQWMCFLYLCWFMSVCSLTWLKCITKGFPFQDIFLAFLYEFFNLFGILVFQLHYLIFETDYDSDYDEPTPRISHSVSTNGQVSLFHHVAPPVTYRGNIRPPMSPKLKGMGPGGRKRRPERDFNTIRIDIHSQRRGMTLWFNVVVL